MKALIKHELRNIWMILLYFVGAFALGIGSFASDLSAGYNRYLWNGYQYDTANNLLREVSRLGEGYMLVMGLGLLVLLYVQFKDNKSISISCFIKSLPYTNKQIYGVKLGCGVLSFTVPFVLAYGVILGIGQSYREWLSIIEQISPVGERLARMNQLDQLLLYGLLVYSVTLMIYLFGFWMQYIVNSNVASLIVSSCSLVALPYLAYMMAEYIRMLCGRETGGSKVERLIESFGRIGELFMLPGYIMPNSLGVEIILDGNYRQSEYIHTLVQVENMGFKLLLSILISLVFFLAIQSCNHTYRAENQERFISYKWAEKGIKIGITVCTVSLAIPFVAILGVNVRFEVIVLHGLMLLFGAIGYFIIHKICKIGQK